MIHRHLQRPDRRSDPAAPRAAGSAAAISIVASALLASLCAFYWYGFIRTLAVFPSPLQYLGLTALSVALLNGPSLVLLGGAQIILNRGVSAARHLCILLLAVTLGVVACEGLILANDASVKQSQAGRIGWQNRWFPFSFRKVSYDESTGRYYADF